MHMMHEYARTLVVKYGGGAMRGCGGGEVDPVLAELAMLRGAGSAVVLVHGGGPEIDSALAELGISTSRIDGLRVTDAATLRVTEAVLCASINKRIVRGALALGMPAVGLSGQDGGMLIAERAVGLHGEDLGYVGQIVSTDVRPLRALLDAGLLPVVAPLAVARSGDHAYNVNADLAAAALAGALRADVFVAITNVPRVFRRSQRSFIGHRRFYAGRCASFRGRRNVSIEHETEAASCSRCGSRRRGNGIYLLGQAQRDRCRDSRRSDDDSRRVAR